MFPGKCTDRCAITKNSVFSHQFFMSHFPNLQQLRKMYTFITFLIKFIEYDTFLKSRKKKKGQVLKSMDLRKQCDMISSKEFFLEEKAS